MRTLVYSFLIACLFANSTTCMNFSKQELARQQQLADAYYNTETFVTYNHCSWRRILEQRKTGNVIVLEPEYHSPYNGNFLVTIKEIHRDAKGTLFEKNIYVPSKPVAFVLGSAIVGSILYWYFIGSNKTVE